MTPDNYMSRAFRALASAELLLADNDIEGACNRAYYAMFDATHAALLWSNSPVNPAQIRTHRGLIAAFGQHLIKPARLPGQLGKLLNQVEHIRLLADYTGEEVPADKAQWAVEQAAFFIEQIQQEFSK